MLSFLVLFGDKNETFHIFQLVLFFKHVKLLDASFSTQTSSCKFVKFVAITVIFKV